MTSPTVGGIQCRPAMALSSAHYGHPVRFPGDKSLFLLKKVRVRGRSIVELTVERAGVERVLPLDPAQLVEVLP